MCWRERVVVAQVLRKRLNLRFEESLLRQIMKEFDDTMGFPGEGWKDEASAGSSGSDLSGPRKITIS